MKNSEVLQLKRSLKETSYTAEALWLLLLQLKLKVTSVKLAVLMIHYISDLGIYEVVPSNSVILSY